MAGKPVDDPPEFYGFESWADLCAASAHPEGEELRTWVGLVTKYGIDDLLRAFDRCKGGEKTASLILSTGHSAKGLEWDTVRLADDFLSGVKHNKDGTLPPISRLAADLRLFYVAVTRAKLQVEIPDAVDDRLRLLMKEAEPHEDAA
jgi:superfamily I DNA/RNA helicase